MSRFYLHAVDEQAAQLPAPQAGAWVTDTDSRDFLERYAASIAISGELKDTHVAHSVPSAFSRPIQFYQALCNPEHPLHAAVKSEWRGLMALFALQEIAGLTLVAKPYSVISPDAPSATPAALDTKGNRDDHIATILYNQLPYAPEDWDSWWLLYCDDALVGATSPWTIGYTAANYKCPAKVFWKDRNGLLADPLLYEPWANDPQSYELSVMRRWVEIVLEGGVWGMAGHLESKAGDVRGELEKWAQELDGYQNPNVFVPELSPTPLIERLPYSAFSRAAKHDGAQPTAQSQLLLKGREGAADVVVLSRKGMDPGKRVWDAVFIDQIDLASLPGPRGPRGWTARTGKTVDVPYVIAEEEFLPPGLADLNAAQGIALGRGTWDFTLPLTPEFFKYFDYATLVGQPDMLRVSVTANNVVVRLRLPLKGGGTLTVEKDYDRETEVQKVNGPTPALAVWPDFAAADWAINYAACASPDVTNLTMAPMLPNGVELTRASAGQTIWPTEQAVMGFSVYAKFKHPPNASQEETHSVGVVLRAAMRSPAPINPTLEWRAGVDFGTSSTHLLVDRGGGPAPMPIPGRLRFLTVAEAGMKEQVLAGLYPEQTLDAPFVTLLAQEAIQPRVISDIPVNTQFSPRFLFYPDMAGTFLREVKWGRGGGSHNLPLRSYLESVAYLIASEARNSGVGKLTFEWSYPLALPEGSKGAMTDFWPNVAATLTRGGGMTVVAGPGLTESDAICRCLAKVTPPILLVLADSFSLAADIGGGSTDIGFWSGARLLDQVSIKLAGNNILPRFWRNREFVSTLYRVCMKTPWDERYAQKFEAYPELLINAVLAQPGASSDPKMHPFVVFLQSKLAVSESPWLEVRSLIYLFFSGLAFYMGLHARKSKPKRPVLQAYFGGRGASLLAWIGSADKTKRMLENALKDGFTRDVPENAGAQVMAYSPAIDAAHSLTPKEEVVRGLLTPPVWVGEAASNEVTRTTIPGEVSWSDSKKSPVEWHTELKAEDLSGLQPPPNYDSCYIAQFMTGVVARHIEEFNLDPRLATMWDGSGLFSSKVQNYVKLGAADAHDTVLEPVFAAELRAILDQYVDLVEGARVLTAVHSGAPGDA